MGRTAQRIEGYDKVLLLRRPYLLTTALSLASAPAISVPSGLSPQGLPFSLQLGGRPGSEEAHLRVAHAYEQSTPWHTMRPPTV